VKECIKRWLYLARYFKAKYLDTKKSYAHDGEDEKILELLGKVNTFIDIGANDGLSSSNTLFFALRGATGVCLEPVNNIFQRLQMLYRFNNRVTCLNYGISDNDTETEIVTSGLLSYLPDTQDLEHRELVGQHFDHSLKKETIRLITFDSLARIVELPQVIDLLDIDVEGHELQVLRSIDFNSYSFRLIILETHTFNEHGEVVWTHRDLSEMEAILGRHGYKCVFKSSANTFYMRQQKD